MGQFISLRLCEALRRAKRVGFDFVDDLIDNIMIPNLSGDLGYSEFVRLVKDERDPHSELRGIVPCRNRNGVLLTNDRGQEFLREGDIAYFDIKGILMVFYVETVLNEEDIKSLVKGTKEEGNKRIKGFEEIFE